MKNLLPLLFFTLFSVIIYGQCPPEDEYYFKSQDQVDFFLSSYPNCTSLENHDLIFYIDITDQGAPIDNLDALKNIVEIQYLSFERFEPSNDDSIPTMLSSFRGLENLETVEYLNLSEVDAIINLEGLGNLKKVNGLRIYSCSNLVDLSQIGGLEVEDFLTLGNNPVLKSIAPLVVGAELVHLDVTKNPKLEELAFLSSLSSVGTLLLWQDDISFVENIEETTKNLSISGTDKLVDLSAFRSLRKIAGNFSLYNLSGMTDLAELAGVDCQLNYFSVADCSLSSLDGIEFNTEKLSLRLENNAQLVDLDQLTLLDNYSNVNLTNCPLIRDMKTFSLVDTMAGLTVENMSGLTDLEGLDNLCYLANGLRISSNENLLNFDGLNNLKHIGINVSITDNKVLQEIDALISVETSGSAFISPSLNIFKNPELTSVLGLGSLFYAYNFLWIVENPMLTACNIPSICNTISNAASIIDISSNGPNCDSEEKVENACGDGVQLKVFYDQNQNGIDDDELALTLGELVINDRYTLFPNSEGLIFYYPFPGINELKYTPAEFWENTTTDVIQIDSNDLPSEVQKIGIYPTETIDGLQTYLLDELAICETRYKVLLIVENTGTTTLDVVLYYTGFGDFISASWPFASMTGTELSFELENMLPGQRIEIELEYLAPGIDEIPLGNFYEYALNSEYTNAQGESYVGETQSYEREFLCAYDPNDKQVHPAGVQDENYTLFEEETLQYTIRFQNTGNYFAQDVSITDTLDSNLDLSTFHFIGASHRVTEIKLEENAVQFVFDNIFLPDSVHNEPESHGFLSYTISPRSDLEEFTAIENTAHIYFDNNPAIVTNTTLNTMVSEIPSSGVADPNVDSSLLIFPNPTTDYIYVVLNKEYSDLEYTIHSATGKLVQQGKVEGEVQSIRVSLLPSGLYFISVGDEVQKFVVSR